MNYETTFGNRQAYRQRRRDAIYRYNRNRNRHP